MEEDRYFERPVKEIAPFAFDQGVADCFEDMLARSVPYYGEIHRILLDLVPHHVRPGERIYDLGCSTGTTLRMLSQQLRDLGVQLIGIDQSAPMVVKAQEKCVGDEIQFICEDLRDLNFQTCGLVVMNYTLQFIPKSERVELLQRIYKSLRPGGLLLLAEKIESQDTEIQQLQTQLYEDFKRRKGYSDLEITQKRKALENVLVPLAAPAQIELLRYSGFDHVDMIFRWFNFACFVGIKKDA